MGEKLDKLQELTPVPRELQELMTTEGFIKNFYLLRVEFASDYKAYDALENVCVNKFGRRRYADYNSFRVVKNKRTTNKAKA